MKTVVFSARKLPDRLIARWAEIQRHNPALVSPYFRPEFTQAVAKVRDDVFVATIDDGAAFFPFERSRLGMGRPVGGPVSDYHGLIAPPDYGCDILSLMRSCRLRSWNFDHVPAGQAMFASWRTLETMSPVIDLEMDAAPGSTSLYADHRRKRRRLERDFGKVEFELDSRDPAVLDLCLKWKSEQYRRTGNSDLFARAWARTLAENIASQHDPEFAGIVSVLRAGGQPVAAHFGMRSATAWHYWFPAYDAKFQSYSPGILMLLDMIASAPTLGVKMIDFGKGDNHYKLRLANRTVPLVEGCVTASPPLWLLSQGQAKLKQLVQGAPLMKSLLMPARNLYQQVRFR